MRVPGIPYVQGRNDYTDWDGRKYGIAIHNTSNDASDEGEASYATRRTDGVSSHFYADRDSVTQSLDTDDRAGHAGSNIGNDHSIAVEVTGSNGKSRQWWLGNVAWDQLGRALAWVLANDPDYAGFEVRRASVAEMRRNPRVKAFYGHDDMRLAWGGTTHTDPGANFPWDRLFDAVNQHLEGDDVSKADVRTGVGEILDEAARRSTPTGRSVGNDIATLLSKATAPVRADVAELRGQVAGLLALAERLLTAPAAPVTQAQMAELVGQVRAAAAEPAERIAAALAAAGDALGEADDDPADES